jgi:hypothetical protein
MKTFIFLLAFFPSLGYSSSITITDVNVCLLNSWQCDKVDEHLAYLREGIADGSLTASSPEIQKGLQFVRHYTKIGNYWNDLEQMK